MAVIQKAIGIAWGMGSTFGITYTAGATVLKASPLQANLDRSANMVEMPDRNGETVGLVFFNQKNEVSLRVYPTDTTLALAVTAGGTMGLAVGDKVAITNADDPDLAGNYVCLKVGKTRKVDGFVEFDITICKWPTDLSTTIT